MVRNKFFIYVLFFCLNPILAQNLEGSWSGILMKGMQAPEDADVIYLKIEEQNKSLTGLSRVELQDNENEFATKSFKGEEVNGKILITEELLRRSSKSKDSPECKLNYELKYIDSSAYLIGTFLSSDCRNMQGKVVLFRSDHTISTEKEAVSTHLWKYYFVRNYKKGYPALEVMKKEQENFKFQTIHFDYDKAEIRPEYYQYLNKMARVLDGIHDLRVKITGHTDSDGTDAYNLDLSERRADALRDYFKARGIEPEKLEIDFKGKRQPIDSNRTKEGRRKNRRVVFEFI